MQKVETAIKLALLQAKRNECAVQLLIPKLPTPFGTIQRLVQSVGKLSAINFLRLSGCWPHVDLSLYDVFLHVATSNEASFAGNLVVHRFVAVDPASREEQPPLGWRHGVDEDLLAESVHLEKSGQLLLLS